MWIRAAYNLAQTSRPHLPMTSIPAEVYRRLYEEFGPQHWWPGQSPLEIIVGAILTQNTSWTNVEKAIHALREAGLMNAQSLYEVSESELAEWIRPAGYFRLKARRLKNFIQFLFDRYDGSLDSMFATGLPALREELLGVNGVGPETADSILLYAAGLPTFVVDTYTARVLKRHGWIEPEADYHAVKEYFESSLSEDAQLFNEYHALLVHVGKDYCRKTPRCEQCPLCEMLPEGGSPLET